jgi:hypothetical protein
METASVFQGKGRGTMHFVPHRIDARLPLNSGLVRGNWNWKLSLIRINPQ